MISPSMRPSSAGVSSTAIEAMPFHAGRSAPSGPTTSSKRAPLPVSGSVGCEIALA